VCPKISLNCSSGFFLYIIFEIMFRTRACFPDSLLTPIESLSVIRVSISATANTVVIPSFISTATVRQHVTAVCELGIPPTPNSKWFMSNFFSLKKFIVVFIICDDNHATKQAIITLFVIICVMICISIIIYY